MLERLDNVLAVLAVAAVVFLGLLSLVADALPPESHSQLTSAQWVLVQLGQEQAERLMPQLQ
jgi:hypothetical protein